ncbi:MAG: GAF domain-containing protein [Anaerolineae bacterium]|nr:GAF domain-containing protein [Anaerolineae bacterium]
MSEERITELPTETEAYQRQVRWVAHLTLVGAASALLFNLLSFFLFNLPWQMLAVTVVGESVVIIGIIWALQLARRGRFRLLALCTVLGTMLAFAAAELLHSQWYLVIGGTLLVFVAASIVWPGRWLAWLLATGIFLVYSVATSFLEIMPRQEIQAPLWLDVAAILLIGAISAFALRNLFRTYRNITTIRERLLASFVLLVVGVMALLLAALAVGGIYSGRQRAIDQLNSVAALKEAELVRWVDLMQADVTSILAGEDREQQAVFLVTEAPDHARYTEIHDDLLERFLEPVQQRQRFEEVFLLNLDSEVVLSTNADHEGKRYGRGWTFFQIGLEREGIHLTFEWAERWVDFVQPVHDENGEAVGVLVGRAPLAILNNLMTIQRESESEPGGETYLGETGETYLVSPQRAVLTQLRESERINEMGLVERIVSVPDEGVYFEVTENRLQEGAGSYRNYNNRAVIGVYRWIPELNVALFAEQGEFEAQRTTYALMLIVSVVAVVAVAAAVGISLQLTRSIATPLVTLAETASQIATGDLTQVARVEREDEIGALARTFNDMTGQLRGLIGSLEQRVQERTGDLERRSAQLEAAARIARETVAVRDVDQVMRNTAQLISEQFGFYHVGIFLLDELGEYAVLRAANSAGGQRMLARGHRLKVGETGIVGYVTQHGQPRIALDVGEDATYFNNPDLPLTRSEVALPLIAGTQIMGALDVQSTEESAFSQEDIAVLSVLADQVAVAIENSRLIAQTQEALAEVEALHYQYMEREWSRLTAERGVVSYEYSRLGGPSMADLVAEEIELAMQKGRSIALTAPENGDGIKSTLAVPIKLGDQVIGVIDVQEVDQARQWTEDEIDMVETISDQMAQALERTRLFEETQSALATTEEQAQRLAKLNEMSEQLSRAVDVQELFDIAAAQTSSIFAADRVSVTMLTAEADSLETMAIHGDAAGRPVGTRVPLENTTLRPVIEEGRLILKTDVEGDEHHGIASFVAAPIYLGGRPAGALVVGSEQPGIYTSRDGNMLLQVASLLSSAIENRQLFEQARARAEELAVLNDLAQALTATFNTREVVEMAYQGASRLIDTANFYIALYDADTNMVNLAINVTDAVDDGHLMSFPADQGLTGHIIRSRKSLLIKKDMAAVKEKLGIASIGKTAQSWMGVPLMIGDQILGVMTVQSYKTTHAYDEADLELMTAIASQTAIALQNANLFEEANIRAEELAVLNDLGQALTATLNVSEVLEQAYRGASQLVDTTNFYIGLYKADKNQVAFAFDVTESEIDKQITVMSADEGITGYVIRTRQSLLIEQDLPQFLAEHGIEQVGETAKCWMGVPLMVGERVLGVMAVQSYQAAHAYRQHDLDLFTAIGSQTAIALQNAYLFEETQTTLAETETLYSASRRISAASDLKEIIAAIVEEVHVPTVDAAVLWNIERDASDAPAALIAMASWEKAGETIAPGTRVPLDTFAAVEVAFATELFYSDNIQEDNRVSAAARAMFAEQGVRTLVSLPSWAANRQIGVLLLSGPEAYHFTERETRPYRSLVRQMTVAVENLRLLEETRYRATQLETAAEVSQAASSILNLDELLPQVAELIRSRFDLYYVGIFLVDDAGQWAVLQAGTGQPGQQMLEAGHRLQIGGMSMIGWSIANSAGRFAHDVGEEAIRFDNPFLPHTRSEMALPLISRGHAIGAMSIQSAQAAAFSGEDVTILQTMADHLANAIENARLFSETERALSETRDLYEASRSIGAALTPDQVRQALVDYAAQSGVDFARLLLLEYDESSQPTHIIMAEGWSADNRPSQPVGTRLLLSSYPILDILDPKERVVVKDIQSDTRLNDATKMLMEVSGLRSFAAVPIAVGKRHIGTLLIGFDQPTAFSEKLLDGLQTITGQAAITLENQRLLQETQRRAREMEAINEMGRTITSVLDLDVLLRQIVDITKTRFGHYFVSIALVEGNQIAMRSTSTIGETNKRLERGMVTVRLDGPGLVPETARTGQPLLVNDVLEDPRYLMVPELSGTRSELDVPIKVKGRVIGVLSVQSNKPHAYDQTDVALLQSLVSQAGVAIDNAQLFAETQAEASRRSLINEVMQAASQSMDPESLLHRAGEAVSRQLETPSAILLWRAEHDALQPIAIHDAQAQDVLLPEDTLITRDMNPSMYQVVKRRRAQILSNTDNLTGLAMELAQNLHIQSAIHVPLVYRDQIHGVFEMCQLQGQPAATAEQVTFAETIAANLSVALDNAYLYQEAVETAEQLKEVDRLKTQFLANMSHELRTPLNSIIGFSRVILKGIDGPVTDLQKQDLEAIHASGQHLLRLINDILDISKVQAGKMELVFEEDVDLKEIVRAVMSTAIALVKDKPVELQQQVPDELPKITADSRRVQQVLLNLVSNAAKFTEEGFIRVAVKVLQENNMIQVAVTDSGIGIAEEKMGTIFEAFIQADASPSRKYGGTGLGLTLSRQMVELHGGEMWVESEVGEGSTFYFTLPIAGPPEPEEETAAEIWPEEPVEEKKKGKLILCVEDDEGVITLYRRYLRKQGYEVIGLTDPSRVIEEAKRLSPQAITLDVMMPGKDGWQVIQELKADPETRHIPVVMCTIVSDKERGLSLGAADYLIKPILEQDLIAALDRLDREEGHHLVLVVDDQEQDRKLLRRMIESQEGYEVVEAINGQEAIAMIKGIRPHIIVLDLMMPDVDGFAVLEAVKADESTRTIPIIIVTAKELTAEERETLNHNIEALIQKGMLEKNELLEDVAAALRKLGRTHIHVEQEE